MDEREQKRVCTWGSRHQIMRVKFRAEKEELVGSLIIEQADL